MTDLAALKTRLLKRALNRAVYRCHGAKAYTMPNTGWGKLTEDGTCFVEDIGQAGLRFVAWADEICPRSIAHKGWYADSYQETTYRGAVLQMPARDGCASYIAAYASSNDCAVGRKNWDVKAFVLDLDGHAFIGKRGGCYGEYEQATRDAALAADGFAERDAEDGRDYDEAWRAGAEYRDVGEEITEARKTVIVLIREIKATRKAREELSEAGKAGFDDSASPTICAVLRAKIAAYISSIRVAQARREKLKDSVLSKYHAAFNEGADEMVFAVAGER